ncbi:MAG: hypothetical protein AABY07_03900, partial [Nanoarchaeota archaeon]
ESPINEELRAMKKGVTVEQYIEMGRKLSEYFTQIGMLIFSYPTFKNSMYKSSLTLKQKAKECIKFCRRAKIDILQVLNATPIPGTELRNKLEAEGRLFPLDVVGWEYHDGLHLCYKPEKGISAYELQETPRMLMKRWYLGNPINRYLNYGNWMTWAYNVFGFPIQFGAFYTKRFVHNLVEKRREVSLEESLLPRRNIFYESLANAWKLDIGKRWGKLAVKTYGGGIARKWLKAYKESGYKERLEGYFPKKS